METILTIAKQLLAPCGLIWLGLIAAAWLALRSRRRRLLVANLILLAAYTLCGNVWLGQTFVSWLNREHAEIDPYAGGPYDAVCVLGGGTCRAPHGKPQLSASGDRLMLGARLYLTGRTDLLVATGRIQVGPRRDLAGETAEIWGDLGIPAEAILRLGGRNTFEEIEEIRLAAAVHQWKRIGLVTSCWHLRRAMALAEAKGLSLDPLPASVPRHRPGFRLLYHLIPQAQGFLAHQLAWKEVLGALWTDSHPVS